MKKRTKMCIILQDGTEINTGSFTLKTETKNLLIREIEDDGGFALEFEDNITVEPVTTKMVVVSEKPFTRILSE